MKNIILENYLKKLNESGASMFIMMALIRFLMSTFMRIMLHVKKQKIEKNLSDKVSEITKIRYTVISLEEKEPNAFCFYTFKRTIFITTGLIKLLNNERQVISVLLHEAGHVINHDIFKRHLTQGGPIWFFGGMLSSLEYMAVKRNINPFQATLIIAVILLVILGKWWLSIGRKAETRADVYTVQFGYSKDLIISLKKLEVYIDKELKKLEKDNPDIRKQYEKVQEFDEHPKTRDRIKKLIEEAELYKALANKNIKKVKQIVYKIIFGGEDLHSGVT